VPGRSYSRGANFLAGTASVGNGAHIVRVYFFELQGLDDDVEIGDGEGRARNLEDIGARLAIFARVQVGALDKVITVISVATPW